MPGMVFAGEFDCILSRPVSPLFQVLSYGMGLQGISVFLVGAVSMPVFLRRLGLLHPWGVAMSLFLILCGTVLCMDKWRRHAHHAAQHARQNHHPEIRRIFHFRLYILRLHAQKNPDHPFPLYAAGSGGGASGTGDDGRVRNAGDIWAVKTKSRLTAPCVSSVPSICAIYCVRKKAGRTHLALLFHHGISGDRLDEGSAVRLLLRCAIYCVRKKAGRTHLATTSPVLISLASVFSPPVFSSIC